MKFPQTKKMKEKKNVEDRQGEGGWDRAEQGGAGRDRAGEGEYVKTVLVCELSGQQAKGRLEG